MAVSNTSISFAWKKKICSDTAQFAYISEDDNCCVMCVNVAMRGESLSTLSRLVEIRTSGLQSPKRENIPCTHIFLDVWTTTTSIFFPLEGGGGGAQNVCQNPK